MSTVRELTPKVEGKRTKGVGRTMRPLMGIFSANSRNSR